MKRTKFIAGALVLSMGLLGTGYAYWTDTLNINAKVSTGKLDVEVTEEDFEYVYIDASGTVMSVADGEGNWNAYDTTKKENSKQNTPITITQTDDTKGEGLMGIQFNLAQIQPGVRFTYEYNMKNNSTVPVIPSVALANSVSEVNDTALGALTVKYGTDKANLTKATGAKFSEKILMAMEQHNTLPANGAETNYILVIEAPTTLDETTLTEGIESTTYNVNINWNQENYKAN